MDGQAISPRQANMDGVKRRVTIDQICVHQADRQRNNLWLKALDPGGQPGVHLVNEEALEHLDRMPVSL